MAENSAGQNAFTLRPWPYGDKKPKNLGEFIARINVERNGFRNVTEEQLRAEIAEQANGKEDANGKDGEELEQDGGQQDVEDQPDEKDIRVVRDEMLRNAEVAHQTAMITLDFVSLLLSKESPVLAGTTLSPLVRESVGIGTLGATALGSSALSKSRRHEKTLIATGRKLLDINETVGSLLAAATRLQKEISLETKYWAEVLAVSESGWSVSRPPHDKHTLGVKFGFSEANPEFRNASVAPMRRADDGSVHLDCGRIGGGSQRVVVTIEKNGRVVGRSHTPEPLPEDAPLQSRVRDARDTAFAQELWHEINREGRSMRSYNVILDDDSVAYAPDSATTIRFRLVSLQDAQLDPAMQTLPAADVVSAGLDLLLDHAHRLNNRKRSQPGGGSGGTAAQRSPNPPYTLLRPIIAFLTHEDSIVATTAFVSDITAVLRSAGLSLPQFVLFEPPVSLPSAISAAISSKASSPSSTSPAESLLTALLTHLDFKSDLALAPAAGIDIRGRTFLGPFVATQYQIHLLPPPASDSNSDQPTTNPLATSFPPAELYADLHEVVYYVRQAAARALALHFDSTVGEGTLTAAAQPDQTKPDALLQTARGWTVSLDGTTLATEEQGGRRIEFAFRAARVASSSTAAAAAAANKADDDEATEAMPDAPAAAGADGGSGQRGERAKHASELCVKASWRDRDGKEVEHAWVWGASGGRGSARRASVEEVVRSVVEGTVSSHAVI